MDRHDATEQILAAKRRSGLTFTALAEQVGTDRTWLTAALLGQHPVPPELAEKVGEALSLDGEVVALLQEIPARGSFESLPPADPTIYRLYEVLQVYGPALKALIHPRGLRRTGSRARSPSPRARAPRVRGRSARPDGHGRQVPPVPVGELKRQWES